MIPESYKILQAFTLKVNEVPLNEAEKRFSESANLVMIELGNQLVIDLKKIFLFEIELLRSRAYYEDKDFQGATHVDYKFLCTENNCSFEFWVECILFIDRIKVSFDIPEIFKMPLSKRTMRSLKEFNKLDEYHWSIELGRFDL